MNLLEATAMTLVTMLLLCALFACLGYAVWMLAMPVWARVLLEAVVTFFGTLTFFVMISRAVEAMSR